MKGTTSVLDIDHTLVSNRIEDAFLTCVEMGKPCFLTIRASRGLGKTRNIIRIISRVSEQFDNYISFIISNSIKQAEKNILPYFRDEGITQPLWKSDGNSYYRKDNKSLILVGGLHDAKSTQANRGTHPNLLYYDEAHHYNYAENWWSLFAKMGYAKNCIKILAGTGGYKYVNALSYVENKIKNKEVAGISLTLTLPEIIEMEQSEKSRNARIEQLEEDRFLEKRDKNGKIVIAMEKHPVFLREIMCQDVEGDIEDVGGLFFVDFDDENISSLVQIDYKRPLYVFCDYGKEDACSALFFQVVGNNVIVVDELFVGGRDKRMGEFALSLAEKLEMMGLITIEVIESENLRPEEIKYITKTQAERLKITFNKGIPPMAFFGDQHGRGWSWNQYFSLQFGTEFGEVADSHLGMDIMLNMIQKKQLIISENCVRLIQDFTEAVGSRNDVDGKLGFSHVNSHTIVCVLYAVQELYESGDIDLIEQREDIKKKILLPQQEKKYFQPVSSNSFLVNNKYF